MFTYPERRGLQRRLAYGNYVRERVFPQLNRRIFEVQGRSLSVDQRRDLFQNDNSGITLLALLKNSKVYCKENVECSICFEKDDTIIRQMKCGHEFHLRCIDKWFIRKRNCPYCRRVFC